MLDGRVYFRLVAATGHNSGIEMRFLPLSENLKVPWTQSRQVLQCKTILNQTC